MSNTVAFPKEPYDVVVVGGGPSGLGAALGAAGAGARVLLLEASPIPGGMGTSALVNNFCNAHYDGFRFIIGGAFGRLRQRLIARDALFVTGGLEPYNHNVFVEEANAMLAEAQVEVRYNSRLEGVSFREGAPARLHLADGAGVQGRFVVDATGDAHIAHLAGVSCEMGVEQGVMPLTWCYILGPVDLPTLRAAHPDAFQVDRNGNSYVYVGGQEWLTAAVRQGRSEGWLTIPRERIAVAYSVPGMDEYLSVNYGRVVVKDPTDEVEMAAAREEGRRQVEQGVRLFRERVPGFAQARLVQLADRIGVRESRQIVGLYKLTQEDVLEGRQFDDVIAQGCYSIDIHEPSSDRTTLVSIPKGRHYDIPLRSLIPASGPGNLLIAGRCISASQAAMSSFRVSPSVMAIGEAAGVAAALGARNGAPACSLAAADVQAVLVASGAILQ